MNKALIQFSVLAVLFFGVFFGLRALNLMKLFNVEHYQKTTEEKLGKLMLKSITEDKDVVISNSPANRLVDRIKERICTANGIDPATIKVHLIISSEVNAFAIPDNHLIINTGLIKACKTPEELCGVMGHEIGHMQHRHVMKKLTKELGIATITSLATGNGNGGMAKEMIKMLSSSAYDRSLESDADRASVDYMIKADIDPHGLANFLKRYGNEHESDTPDALYWIANHPKSAERAEELEKYLGNKPYKTEEVIPEKSWKQLKEDI